ncbi:SAM-dependent methyltransferase [Hanstruepera neustonica]|uniref:SAM-dependent methyltransferase n=1 Tax=Hanstruepera neustonica TaxID=1445657 RepID=A0A2K1DX14_9FLAO|nr:class I SAM-dependent methyltransferase [Hanstruepera neustonica]PNQ72577.1 SAM-dependent methyltransferase [Hanstruepera neustonica]
MDLLKYNQAAWNGYVDKKDRWTIPVTEQEIQDAKDGNWNIVLTPKKPVPHSWFPNLKGLKVLGLACGGGQQGPILAALGANVTIFDNSDKQLQQDQTLSDLFDLNIKTVPGDMRDLSVFADAQFDLIFNPCSILFVDNVLPVWKESHRVLKPGGILMTGLMNPLALQLDEDELKLIYKQPYSDIHSLSKAELEALKKDQEPLIFGHSLSDQIGGQLEVGFQLTHMFEDYWDVNNKLNAYFPAFIATRAVKPSL